MLSVYIADKALAYRQGSIEPGNLWTVAVL
jgi:hypothetical protein